MQVPYPVMPTVQCVFLIGRAGASPPSRTTGPRCLYVCMYPFRVPDAVNS